MQMVQRVGGPSKDDQRHRQSGMGRGIIRIGLQHGDVFIDGVFCELDKKVPGQCFPIRRVAREKLKPQFAHFVRRLQAEFDAFGWLVRVMDVLGRVVVGEVHHQRRALGQKDRFGIAVITLPVEIPVLDQQQPFFGAVGQEGIPLQFLAQIVRVRKDAKQVHVHGQPVTVFNRVIPRAGRNVDAVTDKIQSEWSVRRRFIREIKTNGRLDVFRLARRVHVYLEN